MTDILRTMLDYFAQSKLAGSYFLLLLISLMLLYFMDRKKNLWFILYGMVLLFFIMNPIIVGALVLIFPSLASFAPLTLLVPVLFYIPFAGTELHDRLHDRKTRHIVVLILVFLIFICGNMCGLIKDYSITQYNISDSEEIDIVDYLNELQPKMVLADQDLIPVISARGNAIPLFYGRDLWTTNMDTGIMDGYNEEAYSLFDAMQYPSDNLYFIADTAYEYSCDIIITDYSDDMPLILGDYKLEKKTINYAVYVLNDDN